MNLNTPINELQRIGPVYAKRLRRIGIKRVADLLFHFPSRYQDFSQIIPISKVGINETVTVLGKILDVQNSQTFKKRINITEAVIEDASGAIKAVWFNQPFIMKNLRPECSVVLS